jgi:hypothetical protein
MPQNLFKNNGSFKKQADKKSLILLKSTVIGLFIVLITLMIAFVIIKNKRAQKIDLTSKCSDYKEVTLQGKIAKIILKNNRIIILTEVKELTQSQEIIILDARCGNEINRINLINQQK